MSGRSNIIKFIQITLYNIGKGSAISMAASIQLIQRSQIKATTIATSCAVNDVLIMI